MPLNGHRVLVVEDESIIAFDLMTIIRAANGDAVRAATLAQAMARADEPELTLAILDFRLGSDTSLPVAAKLHAHRVPFIFHTGCGQAEAYGAWPEVPVLSKPADAGALIHNLLGVAKRRYFLLWIKRLLVARDARLA